MVNDWFGVEGAQYRSHGEWSDPEIIYKGLSFNYWDVLDFIEGEFDDMPPEQQKSEISNALYCMMETRYREYGMIIRSDLVPEFGQFFDDMDKFIKGHIEKSKFSDQFDENTLIVERLPDTEAEARWAVHMITFPERLEELKEDIEWIYDVSPVRFDVSSREPYYGKWESEMELRPDHQEFLDMVDKKLNKENEKGMEKE